MDINQLPPSLQQAIRSELKPYETITWLTQPVTKAVRKAHMPTLLFGIPFTAFSIFWMAMASSGELEFKDMEEHKDMMQLLFPLFGIPFVLVGMYLMLSPFRLAKAAMNTAYVITNQRAFSITAEKELTVRYYNEDQLQQRQKQQRADGSGSLYFVERLVRTSNNRSTKEKEGFEHIANVTEAERAIERLFEAQQAEAV